MKVTGTIKLIKETTTFDSGFRKRELVVITNEQYPQDLLIEFVQDKCDILNGYTKGELIDVSINLRGRAWTNKEGKEIYFNTIQGWRIEKTEAKEPTDESTPSVAQPIGNVDADLPF